MKKCNPLIISICLLLLVAGCSQDNVQWYSTKEEAIENGLQQEGTGRKAILSIQDYKGETIVFYEHNRALGVANIAESKKGFSWYRNKPYNDFEGDPSYLTVSFDFETKSGLDVPVLAGKAFDSSIQKIKLKGNGYERELPVHEKSRLFFTIYKGSYELIPIKSGEQ